MNAERLRPAMLAAMVALLAVYGYLNWHKVNFDLLRYGMMFGGEVSKDVTLTLDNRPVLHFRLPSSDIADMSRERQVVFQPLYAGKLDVLRKHREEVKFQFEGKAVSTKLIDGGDYLMAMLPGRKLYLVAREDARTIAAIAWNERTKGRSFVTCRGETFCRNTHPGSVTGLGPIEGPYLQSDYDPARRGLPFGAWAYGSTVAFSLEAAQPAKALLVFRMLKVAPTQQVRVIGKVMSTDMAQKKLAAVTAGGLTLYPDAVIVAVELDAGDNVFQMGFSRALRTAEDAPAKAAYITGIEMSEMP